MVAAILANAGEEDREKLQAAHTPSEPPTSTFDDLSVAAEPAPRHRTISDLPNELLSAILAYLNTTPPSTSELYEEPNINLTYAETTNLKSCSFVSRRWRQAIIPSLYKHLRFMFKNPDRVFQNFDLAEEVVPLLEFVKRNELHRIITSLTILLADDPFQLHIHYLIRRTGVVKFWQSVFGAMYPLELIIVAPPLILGDLASCRVALQDATDFESPYHYLRLQRDYLAITNSHGASSSKGSEDGVKTELAAEVASDAKGDEAIQALLPTTPVLNKYAMAARPGDPEEEGFEEPRAEASILFEIGEWTTILLNEGSFVKAYSATEFWLKNSPSILPDLLSGPGTPQPPLITSTIREMSYIGIFPMHTHFEYITANFPRLDRIYVQIVPRNLILDDEARVAGVDIEDLWMERNGCYALLMRELFNAPPMGNYQYITNFESGDAADKDGWEMAKEYVKRAGNGWKISRDGLFVREITDPR
ncbi:hypothetical protein BJ878DRAFT_508320 [Calycina marina]|uniref:F-box domain-containing protein n=1 Tax=Calycina marina TaxID=1763456 RepID=A0A9P7Z326_9HELO|nr:hypothetical protein BJ878DRAFT_508320 [Calycina marina]